MIKNAPVPFFLKWLTSAVSDTISGRLKPRLMEQMDFLESQLADAPEGGPFMCGSKLTGADIMLSFPLQASRKRVGLTKETYPKLAAYIDLLESQEAYKRSIQKVIEVDGHYDGGAL